MNIYSNKKYKYSFRLCKAMYIKKYIKGKTRFNIFRAPFNSSNESRRKNIS